MRQKGISTIAIIVLVVVVLGLILLIARPFGKKGSLSDKLRDFIPLPTTPSGKGTPPPGKSLEGTPFSMALILNASPDNVCDYPVVGIGGRNLRNKDGSFNNSFLEEAESCGTKVVVALSDRTERILNDGGVGISLDKFRDVISFFDGKIDPYVDSGVIIANGVIDEPHDCNNDWGGDCPTAAEVDEAGKISKEYWPNLPTITNTVPQYFRGQNAGYKFQNIDIVQFQFAFHKYSGDYAAFARDSESYHKQGVFPKIAWGLQAKSGGCSTYQECSMSPDQVKQVSETMCNTAEGEWLSFVFYDTTLLSTEGMDDAIDYLQDVCS